MTTPKPIVADVVNVTLCVSEINLTYNNNSNAHAFPLSWRKSLFSVSVQFKLVREVAVLAGRFLFGIGANPKGIKSFGINGPFDTMGEDEGSTPFGMMAT